MPVLTHLGPAAPCGLTRYESDVFGRDTRTTCSRCLFNLRKVTRHVLDAGRRRPSRRDRRGLPRLRPTTTSIRPMCSRTPTAACSWSTPAAGTSSAARPRSWSSRTCSGRSTGSGRSERAKVADPRGLRLDWETTAVDDLAEPARRPPTRGPAAGGRGVGPSGDAPWRGEADAVRIAGRAIRRRSSAAARGRRRDARRGRLARSLTLAQSTTAARQMRSGRHCATRRDGPPGRGSFASGLWRDAGDRPTLVELLRSDSATTGGPRPRPSGGSAIRRPCRRHAGRPWTSRADSRAGAFADLCPDRDQRPDARPGRLGPSSKPSSAGRPWSRRPDGGRPVSRRARRSPSSASPDAANREAAAWVAGRHPEWGAPMARWFASGSGRRSDGGRARGTRAISSRSWRRPPRFAT